MKQISPPRRTWRAVLLKSIGWVDYSAFCFSASPRISPSDAPESEEPYCATACFSSAICNALIEKLGFLLRSKPITIASTFWPVWKRSGRCSSRSRPRSLRLMKPVAPSSPAWTSRPPSRTSRTVTVTVAPLLRPLVEAEMPAPGARSEEHTSEFLSLMRLSYDGFCLKKNTNTDSETENNITERLKHQ